MDDRYIELMKEKPQWFTNLPGGIEILTDAKEIARTEAENQTKVGVIYEDEYVILIKDAVIFGDAVRGTYIRMYHKNQGGVSILVLCGDKVLLLKHFRHSLRRWIWETPRGFGEHGQSPNENAMRELYEEIGVSEAVMIPLGEVIPDAGIIGETVTLYCTRISPHSKIVTEIHEGIGDAAWFTKAQLKDAILKGEIVDGITISALAYAELKNIL